MTAVTRNAHRTLIRIDLKPVMGARFQPTGFPDLGAARFSYPAPSGSGTRWVDALVVESAQSMANRLEGTGWDEPAQRPVPELDGLPYVRVVAADGGRYLTSSRTEPHRLASAYVMDAKLGDREGRDVLRERLGLRDATPLDHRAIARAVAALDPLCLLHGVFFAQSKWPNQPKLARAVTAFIEAVDVREAVLGGVKRDHVQHALRDDSSGTAEGYGNVPYHRVEYTAQRITLHVAIDTAQLASYGLGEPATALLETLALWELRTLLDRGLRLRTACDLVPADPERVRELLPARDELGGKLRKLIAECADLFGDGQPLELTWAGGGKKRG